MEIISGHFGDPAWVRSYRAERLGDTLVERIVWGEMPAPRTLWGERVADTGFIWFRFWLSGQDQVVERYYDDNGKPIGTQIYVCLPLSCDESGCRTRDLFLHLWLSADGRVTVHDEDTFEHAVSLGLVDAAEAGHAELQLRSLTAAIARRRFPPPLVRNWRPDLSRIAASLESAAPSASRGNI